MRIGVDLGGTKIEAIALGDDGRELARRRVATPRHDYDATLGAIVSLVNAIEQETGREGSVGVGMPGALSPASGLVKNANSTWLIGRAIDRDLARALGRPVRCANDANCFALSEATDGAAAGARVVFGVIVGTGTGGGVVVDGRVLTGPERDRRRVGAQSAALAARRREARAGLLLRQDRLHRDVPLRARARARLPGGHGRGARRARDRGARRARRSGRRCRARALRGPHGARARRRPEPARPRRGRARRRHVAGRRGSTRACRGSGRRGRSPTAITTPLRPPLHGDSSGVRGAAWLWGPDGR